MPLSDLVGLVPKTVIVSPSRILPPTNSLPPRRWPAAADRIGIVLGDSATEKDGDRGGSRKAFSTTGSAGRVAPGLNENAGRAGDLGFTESFLVATIKDGSMMSMADRGRLPAALDRDDGAEDDDGRAGNTKGGFGGGSVDFDI